MKVKVKEVSAHWGYCVCEIFHSLYTTVEFYSIEKTFLPQKTNLLPFSLPLKFQVYSTFMTDAISITISTNFWRGENIKKCHSYLFTFTKHLFVFTVYILLALQRPSKWIATGTIDDKRRKQIPPGSCYTGRKKVFAISLLCFHFLIPH